MPSSRRVGKRGALIRTDVTATAVARHFADVINRVVYRGERFRIFRAGQAVAELSPVTTGRRLGELVTLLANIPSLGDDAAEFVRDIDSARQEREAAGVRDPWAS